jgi:predicted nucleic acid-binding protein
MIIDASVLVAIFRSTDVHYAIGLEFLEAAVATQRDLHIPNLALPEVAGVFVRHTGDAQLANRTIRAVLALPRMQRHECADALADRAAALASRCRLRGADAVYVSLAELLDVPLISLDQEILERAKRVVTAQTPQRWLHDNS